MSGTGEGVGLGLGLGLELGMMGADATEEIWETSDETEDDATSFAGSTVIAIDIRGLKELRTVSIVPPREGGMRKRKLVPAGIAGGARTGEPLSSS